MGQLCEIAEVFYKLNNMTVRILESRNDNPDTTGDEQTDAMSDAKAVVVKYRLDFDNRDYVRHKIKINLNFMHLDHFFYSITIIHGINWLGRSTSIFYSNINFLVTTNCCLSF